MAKICPSCNIEKKLELFEKKGARQPFGTYCKECINIRSRNRTQEENDNINNRLKVWYSNNKDKINERRRKYLQKKRDEDPLYRVMMSLHCRLYMAVEKKQGNTMELTGCSKEHLINHIESMFVNGMSWDNYGEWHIDHIRPCASFDLTNIEQQKQCFNWTNLQPLWASDNIRKGAKYFNKEMIV